MTQPFFVYLVECNDNSYYCGYTTDLTRRIGTHNAGNGGHYTKSHRPVKLVYSETWSNRTKAIQREREIKKLNRKQKTALIQNQ